MTVQTNVMPSSGARASSPRLTRPTRPPTLGPVALGINDPGQVVGTYVDDEMVTAMVSC